MISAYPVTYRVSNSRTTETDPKLLKQLRKVKGYELVVVDTPPALRSDALSRYRSRRLVESGSRGET